MNLLVAIPMAVVDLGVSIAVTLAGLAWLVIGPVMDIVQVTTRDTNDTFKIYLHIYCVPCGVCCVCTMCM